jgi:hypothetical protein
VTERADHDAGSGELGIFERIRFDREHGQVGEDALRGVRPEQGRQLCRHVIPDAMGWRELCFRRSRGQEPMEARQMPLEGWTAFDSIDKQTT